MAERARRHVTPADVRRDVYLADTDRGRLFRVMDVHVVDRLGGRVRVAMLEDVLTGSVERWPTGEMTHLRVVEPRADVA